MIKVGETAFLKTTGEVVFVLHISGISDNNEYERCKFASKLWNQAGHFSGQAVMVRLPILSAGGGIEHKTETFLIEELETAQEKFDRELKQFTELQKRQPLRPLENDVDSKKRVN
jgi:hypothetical protein